ncbi:hypothetical protein [Streptomyces sp. 891-h]|uniref:hypothetical protein n=1 Tax=unclassified Streptomyces TaxID=2593676 RepID=UPI001FAAFE85|nr:hypothetical protein [Streptomyces sp. 891-h]UNZ15840.1 hypothetical protein HC362_00785 [Streptomyces sp. 891-h]
MLRWEVHIPTIAPDGTRGVHTFVYSRPSETCARDSILADALTDALAQAAIRHRRGACADTKALTITVRDAGLL